jgi:hypothetical protein
VSGSPSEVLPDDKRIPQGPFDGIVRDNSDPDRLGRIRAEVPEVGFVDGLLTGWARCVSPFGGEFNRGDFVVPAIGANVLIQFIAGDPDRPICMGTFPAKPANLSESPKGVREQQDERIAVLKGIGRIARPSGRGSSSEPANPFAPVYPDNRTRKSGAVVEEIDSTPNHERYHVFHVAGTFFEIHPDGSLVVRISARRGADGSPGPGGRSFSIVEGDDERQVGGNQRTQVIRDRETLVEGDDFEEVGGDRFTQIDGSLIATALRDVLLSTSNELQLVAGVRTHVVAPEVNLGLGIGQAGVVTTATHPIDFMTGLPIQGSSSVKADS